MNAEEERNVEGNAVTRGTSFYEAMGTNPILASESGRRDPEARVMPRKSRTELIQIAQEVINATFPEEEEDRLLEEFKKSVSHPRVSDIIYHSEPPLTAEEVVEQALAYRPIEL
ncbi:bacteriocin immunity protein [Streptomyces sp. NPDC007205]|uniref:bacteriocin immunity protein n=1 Tax=Streptomyces sp. NPDC007205 TaxID=3154316 RepID=UPI0033CF8A34